MLGIQQPKQEQRRFGSAYRLPPTPPHSSSLTVPRSSLFPLTLGEQSRTTWLLSHYQNNDDRCSPLGLRVVTAFTNKAEVR